MEILGRLDLGSPFSGAGEATEIDTPELLQEVAGNVPDKIELAKPAPEKEVEKGGDGEPNIYKRFAELLKAKGSLGDDLEITDDITGEDLVNHFESKYKPSEEAINELVEREAERRGFVGTVKKYAEYLNQGIPLEMANDLARYKLLSTLNLKSDDLVANEKNAAALIQISYQEKYKGDRLKAKIQSINPESEDFWDEATDAQEHILEKANAIEASWNAEVAAKEQEEVAKGTNLRKVYETIIDKGIVGGIELSKKDIEKLKTGLWKATETVTMTLEDGNKVTQKVTLYDKNHAAMQSDPEKALVLANFILEMGDMSKIVQKGKKESMDEFEQVLRSDFGSRGGNAPKSRFQPMGSGELIGRI